MSMFTRRPEAAPLPTPPVADDPEPAKTDVHGFMNPAYSAWQWRDAERRRDAAAALARIGYTDAQTRAVIAARNDRSDASATLERLRGERDQIRYDLRRRRDEIEGLGRQGYGPPAGSGLQASDIEALAASLDPYDAKIERAREAWAKADAALTRITAAADGDVGRRRAAHREAS